MGSCEQKACPRVDAGKASFLSESVVYLTGECLKRLARATWGWAPMGEQNEVTATAQTGRTGSTRLAPEAQAQPALEQEKSSLLHLLLLPPPVPSQMEVRWNSLPVGFWEHQSSQTLGGIPGVTQG